MEHKSMSQIHDEYVKKVEAVLEQFPYDEEVLRKNQLMNAPLAALEAERKAAIEALHMSIQAKREAAQA